MIDLILTIYKQQVYHWLRNHSRSPRKGQGSKRLLDLRRKRRPQLHHAYMKLKPEVLEELDDGYAEYVNSLAPGENVPKQIVWTNQEAMKKLKAEPAEVQDVVARIRNGDIALDDLDEDETEEERRVRRATTRAR